MKKTKLVAILYGGCPMVFFISSTASPHRLPDAVGASRPGGKAIRAVIDHTRGVGCSGLPMPTL